MSAPSGQLRQPQDPGLVALPLVIATRLLRGVLGGFGEVVDRAAEANSNGRPAPAAASITIYSTTNGNGRRRTG
jgi:hypothetical protein